MEPQILVTGGGGYIGTPLIRAMVEDGRRPLVADIRPGEELRDWAAQGRIDLLVCDVATPEAQADKLRTVDTLVHLAARMDDTTDVVGEGIASVEQNLVALMTLLGCLPKLRHVCFLSSMMVYADPPRYSPMDERHPTLPGNTYGVTKLAGEQYLHLFARQAGIRATVLRVCGVYGPGRYSPLLAHRAIPTFIRLVAAGQPPVVYGDGSERRDYVFVDDVVRAIQLSCRRRAEGVYNIGSGGGVSIRELAHTIISLFGKSMEPLSKPFPKPTETFDYSLDITKARQELGYEPAVSIVDGLAREIAWFAGQQAHA
jgi:UDP-glucose 4-epimerase